jgi:sterol desaturase/sphingolipid hydroxylase (fatty acid hydroxylase superfamily)
VGSDALPRVTGPDSLEASPAIFPSPALDRLTRAHPATPAVVFLPVVAILGFLGVRDLGLGEALLAAAAGYLFWTLCEYWGHRTLFHFEPDHGIGRRLHWMIHGVHHDHPNDPRRLVLPPAFSIPLALLFLLAFVGVLGTPLAWAFASGFYLGYVIYDTLHFLLHHTHPKGSLGRRLRELHMRHHFEDDERGFGVSAPWWDIVFRTRPRRRNETRRVNPASPPPPR